MIIGITGYAQHGKDTVGDILVRNHGYSKVALADKVREFALAVDPLISWNNHVDPLSKLVSLYGWDNAKQRRHVRHLLQRIGTEAGRGVLGEDVWINALFAQMKSDGNYVITDVRFPNEAKRIIHSGGEMWRVVRPGFDNGIGTEHESERHIATLPVSYEIINDGSVKDLERHVRDEMWRMIR